MRSLASSSSFYASLSQDRQQKEAQNTRRLTRENDILCVETKESINQSKEERKREKKAEVKNPKYDTLNSTKINPK